MTEVRSSIVRRPSGRTTAGALSLNVPISARGTAQTDFTQDFDVVPEDDEVLARVSITYRSANGDVSTASASDVAVLPPLQPSPPPPVTGVGRIVIVGGQNLDVYLGCFTCNEFDVESVFNQFGRYGSRFSATSIWNQFSQYGSAFSAIGACNPFASRPPVFVQASNLTILGDVTVNRFRAGSIPAVINWLESVVCRN